MDSLREAFTENYFQIHIFSDIELAPANFRIRKFGIYTLSVIILYQIDVHWCKRQSESDKKHPMQIHA